MRHRKKKGRLNRKTAERKAVLKHLTKSLFTYQRIETTVAKAKALRSFAEPLITRAKNNAGSVSSQREVFRKLGDKDVVKNLFDNLAPLYKEIPGGYTRIMLSGRRKGDGTQKAVIELTKRTISDDKLLRLEKIEEVAPKTKQKKSAAKTKKAKDEKPDTGKKKTRTPDEGERGEKNTVLDAKKQKAKKEQEKVAQKGIFKRFRRKSI